MVQQDIEQQLKATRLLLLPGAPALLTRVTAGGKHAALDANDFFEQSDHCMARLVRDISSAEGFKDAIASGRPHPR